MLNFSIADRGPTNCGTYFLELHQMKRLKEILKVIVQTFKNFGDDRIPKYSASLAYTTVFSLGPLLIVIIFLCSIFLGQEATQGKIYSQMQQFVGKDVALQLQV